MRRTLVAVFLFQRYINGYNDLCFKKDFFNKKEVIMLIRNYLPKKRINYFTVSEFQSIQDKTRHIS